MANIFGIEFPPAAAAPTPPVSLPIYASAQALPSQTLVTGVFSNVDFTTTVAEQGITVDLTNGVFEILTTGVYLVSLKATLINTSGSTGIADVRIRVNGNDPTPFIQSGTAIPVGGADTVETSNIISLDAGDIVGCVASCSGAGTPTIAMISAWLYKIA